MKRLLLAGGGHGHINVLKKLTRPPLQNIRITLITDFEKQYYSGMLPGFIEGIYTEEEICFNVRQLCEKAKVEYVEEKIIEIDGIHKKAITDRNEYDFDYISMNLGASSKEIFEIDSSSMTYVKPIASIVDLVKKIEVKYKEIQNDPQAEKTVRVGIIGSGASGIEIALALASRYPSMCIEIIGRKKNILEKFNESTREKSSLIMQKRGINIRNGEEVIDLTREGLITDTSHRNYDFYIISNGYTGLSIRFLGYEVTEENYLMVGDDLRANEFSIAMGDMISLKNDERVLKAGVFAIRQAPILFDNLLKMLKEEKDLRTYRAVHNYLQIISTGSKTAVLNYGKYSLQGRIAWLIKDYIDRAYMKM